MLVLTDHPLGQVVQIAPPEILVLNQDNKLAQLALQGHTRLPLPLVLHARLEHSTQLLVQLNANLALPDKSMLVQQLEQPMPLDASNAPPAQIQILAMPLAHHALRECITALLVAYVNLALLDKST